MESSNRISRTHINDSLHIGGGAVCSARSGLRLVTFLVRRLCPNLLNCSRTVRWSLELLTTTRPDIGLCLLQAYLGL